MSFRTGTILILLLCVTGVYGQHAPNSRRLLSGITFGTNAAAPVPTLVQHQGGSWTRGDGMTSSSTNKHYVALGEYSQQGNTLLMSYIASPLAGSGGIAVGDDQTNIWTQLKVATDGTPGRGTLFIFCATNIKANTHQIYVTNASGATQTGLGVMDVSEWANVVAVNPVDVSSTNFGASLTVTAGSITPTVSGDLLYMAAFRSNNVTESSMTTQMFTNGAQSDINWEFLTADNQEGITVQAGTYTNTTAINPTLFMRNSRNFLTAVVALKASSASQGSPRPTNVPYLVSLIHQGEDTSVPLTNVMQVPLRGDFQAIMMAGGSTNWAVTNITSSCGNVFKQVPGSPFGSGSGDTTQIWYCTNAVGCSTQILTLKHFGSSPGHWSWMAQGWTNAATLGYDVSTNTTGNGGSTITSFAMPGLAPSTNSGIMVWCAQWQFNTAIGTSSPTNNFFDSEWWDGMPIDGPESLDQNGGWSHFKVSTAGTYTNTWSYLTNRALGLYSMAGAAFNVAAAGSTNTGGGGCSQLLAFVQSGQQDAASSQNGTKTLTNNVAAGNLLVVVMREGSGGGTCTITNLIGSTAATATEAKFVGSSDGHTNRVFYFANTASGTCKVGYHFGTGATTARWAIYEFSGCSTTSPFDQANSNTGNSGSPDSGNVTTGTCNELIFGFTTVENTANFTQGSGFTQKESIATKCGGEYKFVTGTGTYSAPQSIDVPGNWTDVIATFK